MPDRESLAANGSDGEWRESKHCHRYRFKLADESRGHATPHVFALRLTAFILDLMQCDLEVQISIFG